MKVKIQVSITILLFCCQTLLCLAQSNQLKKANEFYNQFAFDKAIELYKKVIIKEPNNVDALTKLAHAYRLTGNITKSLPAYKKAIVKAPNHHDLKWHYAQSLLSTEQYQEALQWFLIYKELVPSDSRSAAFIKSCQNIEQYKGNNATYTLQNLTINSPNSDFSPVFYKQGLVFTSMRNESTFEQKNKWTGEAYTDVYYTSLARNKSWTRPVKLPGKANNPFHEGPVSFNSQFTKMYFTRNAGKKTNQGDVVNLKIYQASWIGGKWQQETELSFNSDSYSVAHPSLSKDGKSLYFTSNMPGGFGGKDIYVSNLTNGSWGTPKNLGAAINSEGDESFPFIHEDGHLYFSSNGKGGLGGLDIFKAKPIASSWQLEHMLTPINSSKDDFSFIFDTNNQIGYFSSNRKGGKGNDDIYKITARNGKVMAQNSVNSSYSLPHKASTSFVGTPAKSNFFKKRLLASHILDTQDFRLVLMGIVVDNITSQPISKGLVTLTTPQTGRVDSFRTHEDGSFYFKLLPDKTYMLKKISPSGDVEDSRTITTVDPTKEIFHVVLESAANIESMVDKKPEETKFEELKVKDYATPVLSPNLTDPAYSIIGQNKLSFKVQIGAFSKPPNVKGDKFKNIGVIEKELSKSKRITKYLAGNFDNYREALKYRDILELDGFKDAFVVSYLNGHRLEKSIQEVLEIYSNQ